MITFFMLDWLYSISHCSILTKCISGKSNYFCGKRNEEKDKNQGKYQDKLNVKEDIGDTNPKVGKTSNKSCNFQAKWLKEHMVKMRKKETKLCFAFFVA